MLKRDIVVGASSGIGEALARRLSREGYRVGLVARREERLEALASVINEEQPGRAICATHDVTDVATCQQVFDGLVDALDGLDLIVYSAGVMPAVGPEEFSTEKDKAIIEVNVIGAIAWLNCAAERFQTQGHGTIVGIGSVAGDRGRRGQPAYAASKAALHTYLEALRNRLDPHGVHVLTIKPGPTHTPMTEGLDKLPMAIDDAKSSDGIFKAVARRAQTAYVPMQWWPIMAVIRAIPSVLFRRMPLD